MRIVAVDAGRAAELRALARREPDPRTRVRLLGVANALGGMAIDQAARAVGAGRATLYDWLGRYRAEGVAGLAARPAQERPAAAADGRAGGGRSRPGSRPGRSTRRTG